jgi:nitronate monooxygenase
MLGTRFTVSEEALYSEAHKQALLSATTTQVTDVIDMARNTPWPDEYIGKIIANTFSKTWSGKESQLKEFSQTHSAYYQDATQQNDLEIIGIFAGNGVKQLTQIQSKQAIMRELCLAFYG